jgi:ubiquinone/menaquinone biosynthesis C-methylase UbiE
MGVGGADWLVRPERETEEHPSEALDQIGITAGSTVADIGAGVGFYTKLLVDRAGPSGKIYAVDIQRGMLDQLRRRVPNQNVIPVLGTESDPRLPPHSIDLELLVDVYHEFSHPQEMLEKLRAALKADGRLAVLEFRGEDRDLPIRPEHKMTAAQVLAEFAPAGFRLAKRSEKLPRQHIFIFVKADRRT